MVKTFPRFAPRVSKGLTSGLLIGFTAMSLASCQAHSSNTSAVSVPAEKGAPPQTASQDEALTFAQAACGGCHSIEYPGGSPNPNSPTFAAIANREGLNEDTLASWLTDAHNYPEVMDFDLTADQVELIAAHMLTLRRDEYEPEI